MEEEGTGPMHKENTCSISNEGISKLLATEYQSFAYGKGQQLFFPTDINFDGEVKQS